MNDRNHFDLGTSAPGSSGKSDTLVLLERLEELRVALRAAGVVRVLVAYEKDSLGMAFMDSREMAVMPPNLDKVSDELAGVLAPIIRRRCPVGVSP